MHNQTQVTRTLLDNLIQTEAHRLFQLREPLRQWQDWVQAIADWGLTFRPIPHNHSMRKQVEERAHQRWLERKEQDAKRDWLDAEQTVWARLIG